MFRHIWLLATDRRKEMLREWRQNDVDALVGKGRALHGQLRGERSGGVAWVPLFELGRAVK